MEIQLTAREMFEKLGYKQLDNNEYRIYYVTKKGVGCGSRGLEFIHKYKKIVPYNRVQINMELLQAINKQVEELGWLDVKN